MKKKSRISSLPRHLAGALLLLAAVLPLGGCIHQYPEAGAYTPVTVTFEVETDTSLPLYQSVTRTADTPDELKRRFIIDAYLDGKALAEKRIVTTQAVEVEEGKYAIPTSMQLDARHYTFTAWCDYVADDNAADLHFDTTVPAQVSLCGDYHPACTRREAFCGTASADLTPYQEAQDAQDATAQNAPVHHQHIDLKRPQAKFTLLSTDTEEFLRQIQKRGYGGSGGKNGGSSFRVKLAYEYYFPTGYNMAQDLLCESHVGMSFIAPCGIVPDESGECELTSDYVLQGTDASYVVLTLEVADTGGKVLSRMTGVQVPLKQGHLTLVRGKFLTTLMNAGIGIDPGYEGEFNIVIK